MRKRSPRCSRYSARYAAVRECVSVIGGGSRLRAAFFVALGRQRAERRRWMRAVDGRGCELSRRIRVACGAARDCAGH